MCILQQKLKTHAPPHSNIPVRSWSDLSLKPIVVARMVIKLGSFIRSSSAHLGLFSRDASSPQPVKEKGR